MERSKVQESLGGYFLALMHRLKLFQTAGEQEQVNLLDLRVEAQLLARTAERMVEKIDDLIREDMSR